MKFNEMPYVRPDASVVEKQMAESLHKIEAAGSAQEQVDAYLEFEARTREASTACSLGHIRHSIDTRDAFYDKENDFLNRLIPTLREGGRKVSLALMKSPFRAELEGRFGKLFFTNMEVRVRTISPAIMEMMREEGRLQSEYQKLCASATAEWKGEKLPLTRLAPFKESTDRAERRAAYELEGRWYDSHQEELDSLFDRLVQCRTAQGKALGYENYLPLGYDRMRRNCYGPEKVAAFREQIAQDMVPVAAKVKKAQEKRLGVDKLNIYDDTFRFPNGNAIPRGTADDILAAGREMYRALSAETAEFIDFLYENGLLDVLSKEGKAPGGYCATLSSYKAPFIFANFTGTNDDVDTLTHEAGHAFAAYRAGRKDYLYALTSPTMEACEVHSMSMEFLTAPWHGNFFGPLTRQYEIEHCESALTFIPYGCMVDEFQHVVYENPGLTPAQRNGAWLELERKYRPWMEFDNLPFYSRGAGWQRQRHIYLNPLYYIDYCMAQTVAFQFWLASLEDQASAWAKYLRFVDAGGTKNFEQLVETAGLELPYAPGCIGKIGAAISDWLDKNPL